MEALAVLLLGLILSLIIDVVKFTIEALGFLFRFFDAMAKARKEKDAR